MAEFVLTREWEARYLLRVPPDLTPEIASRRWRAVNVLVRAPLLLLDRPCSRKWLTSILQVARTILPAEQGLLYLCDESGRTLNMEADFGFARRVPERLRSINPLAAAAIGRRKPVLVRGAEEFTLARELRLLGKPSCLSVPILRREVPWGVLQLGRREPFREDDGILLWIYALVLEAALPGPEAYPVRRRAGGLVS